MYVLNGIRLSPNKAFTHNGVQYPANWIELSTESEKFAIGIEYFSPTPTLNYAVSYTHLRAHETV